MKNKLRKFIAENEFENPIYYRPGTLDEHIIDRLIVKQDEYKFIQTDAKIVYDIGANIGIATLVLASVYPKAVIHCFEPEPENFEILRLNTEHLGDRVVLNKVALSNSNGAIGLFGPSNPDNHGGYSIHIKPEEEIAPQTMVPTVRASYYSAKVGIPDIIKIDCEGAEHDILLDIPDLQKVQFIVGELHDVKSHELLSYLDSKGFELEFMRKIGLKNWPFMAINRGKFMVKDAPQPTPVLAADT